MLEGSIEHCKTSDEQWYKAVALSFLGEVALYENDFERAMFYCHESIKLAQQQGDPWCMMPSLMTFGQIAVVEGDFANALSYYQEVVDLLHKIVDKWSLSWALNDLGHVMLAQGELDQAGIYLLEGLTTARELGEPGGFAHLAGRDSCPDCQAVEESSRTLSSQTLQS